MRSQTILKLAKSGMGDAPNPARERCHPAAAENDGNEAVAAEAEIDCPVMGCCALPSHWGLEAHTHEGLDTFLSPRQSRHSGDGCNHTAKEHPYCLIGRRTCEETRNVRAERCRRHDAEHYK